VIQWPWYDFSDKIEQDDINGTMAKRKTTKGQEKFEDTKWVIRSLIGGQTTQWLKEIGQTDKQRSKNITQKLWYLQTCFGKLSR
jgi:hypothetical protein